MQTQRLSANRAPLREVARRVGYVRSGAGRLRVSAAVTALPKQFKKVNPVGDRIFVKVDKAEVKSTGGLVLPTSAQKAPTQGQVVTVSKDCDLKVGDKVVYGEYTGSDLAVGGTPHVILKEEDVVGLMKSPDVEKLEPLGDRILVKISEIQDETTAGLLLTSASTEKPTFGTVLSVGPGKKVEGKQTPPNVTVGSTILYSKYSGVEFQGKDETEYIVIRETDVLAELD